MTVKELRDTLNLYPDDMEVLTKKTEQFGNVAFINSVRSDVYAMFGIERECLLLTDEEDESEE